MKIRYTAVQIHFFLVLIACFLIFTVGFRPDYVGTDTKNYVLYYNSICQGHLAQRQFEYFFHLIALFVSLFSTSSSVFLSLITLIDFILVAILVKKLLDFADKKIDFYRLFFLLGTLFFLSPFFFSITVNVIRHGIAILSLFIFCILLAFRTNLLALIPLGAIALGFHRTSIIIIVFSLLIFLTYRAVLYTTLTSAFFYLSGLTAKFIYLLSKITGIDLYFKISSYAIFTGYNSGIRYDFAVFTILMGALFHFLNRYFLAVEDRLFFLKLLKIYWILVLPFFFFGFAAYSDRYLLAGWLYLSVLTAVFLGLLTRKYRVSIQWDFLIFICSAMYFMAKVQAIISFLF